MHACACSAKQKYGYIYIYFLMKTFLKTGVYIYIYIYIYMDLMRVTSFLAIIKGNVAVSKNFYFILSVIHIISVRLLSFGTRVLLSFGTCRCHFCLKSYGYLRLKL